MSDSDDNPNPDPGLDLYDWTSEWASLEDDMKDAPSESLPLVADLVARMLEERGIEIDEEDVVAEGTDPEIAAEYREAQRIAASARDGEDVAPGDVASALAGFRNLFEYLTSERGAG
jgi:hypothetical protein